MIEFTTSLNLERKVKKRIHITSSKLVKSDKMTKISNDKELVKNLMNSLEYFKNLCLIELNIINIKIHLVKGQYMKWLSTNELKGKFVTLEPLGLHHIDELKEAVLDGVSWKLWFANVPSPENMDLYVKSALEDAKKGGITFAVKCNTKNKIVGTTRFYNVDSKNRRAMLGYTWYSESARKTPINTECKFLLLSYIFEKHSAIAVEFRTHFLIKAQEKQLSV